MSKSSAGFSIVGVGLVAWAAAACSDAAKAAPHAIVRYASEGERPPCEASIELQIAYAAAEGSTSICSEGAWISVQSPDTTGATGAAGATGSASRVAVTSEPPGVNCPAGGFKLVFFVDANGNGALDGTEGQGAHTVYACNAGTGASGATGAAGGAGAGGATGPVGATGATGTSGAAGSGGAAGATGATGSAGATGATGVSGCVVSIPGVSDTQAATGSGQFTCTGRFTGSVSYVCAGGNLTPTGACTCAPRYTGANCASCAPNFVAAGDACVPVMITFSKADNADPAVATNQDCIKPDVCITRGVNKSIYNAASTLGLTGANDPSACTSLAPAGTQWAKGACGATTTAFGAFLATTFASCNPPTIVNLPGCLYLPAYGEYYDIKFTSWTQNGGGGGFAYTRSAGPIVLGP